MAQNITVKGILTDTAGTPLPSATVMIMNLSDTSLLAFSASNQDGSFEIKNLKPKKILLRVTFVGYETLNRSLTLNAEFIIDLGVLMMRTENKILNEITINAARAPVIIKQDTIEFDAVSFKPAQNSSVEDLLKKLPGIEVDNDGTIRSQGEKVRRVTVDGKDFFGTDPKIATRNLPADAIGKIQVYDRKSDQAAFSGIDDGQREKTINLQFKPEKRNAAFGNIMAGAGIDERLAVKANFNRFQKGQQFSLLTMANNINEQGFGLDEYMNFTGGSQQMIGGGGRGVRLEVNGNNQNGVPLNFNGRANGLMNNYAGGINFNKDFTKKSELNSSYFYNFSDLNLTEGLERENFTPMGTLLFNQQGRRTKTNENHRVNVVLGHKLDSVNSIKTSTMLTYNTTESREHAASQNQMQDHVLLNVSNRNTYLQAGSFNLNTNTLWRHKFLKKGRTFSINMSVNVVGEETRGELDATTEFNVPVSKTENLIQHNRQLTKVFGYGTTMSYTEPLGGRMYLETNYTFRHNRNIMDRKVYDVEDELVMNNEALSNRYTGDYQYHRPGMNVKVNKNKYNFTLGGSLQQTQLIGHFDNGFRVNRSYQNVQPVARFNYNFSSTRWLNLDYETSVIEPSVQQLQPVIENSDPLNLQVGNPDLRPALAHSWRLKFWAFDPATFINLFAFADASLIDYAIIQSQQITDDQIRISKPVNVSGTRRISTNITLGFPVTTINSRFSMSANASYQHGANLINDIELDIIQSVLGGRFRYDFRYKELMDVNVSAVVRRQTSQYEFAAAADQLFYNNSYTAETNWSIMKHYKFNADIEYLFYENRTTGFKQSVPLLNMSLSGFVLKANRGELKASVVNLFNFNIGINQTFDLNYSERQTTNALGRYFLLTFTYTINKQFNPMAMRPGGNTIRMER